MISDDGIITMFDRDEQGWDVHAVADMAQLVAFAHAFSRRRYGDAAGVAVRRQGDGS